MVLRLVKLKTVTPNTTTVTDDTLEELVARFQSSCDEVSQENSDFVVGYLCRVGLGFVLGDDGRALSGGRKSLLIYNNGEWSTGVLLPGGGNRYELSFQDPMTKVFCCLPLELIKGAPNEDPYFMSRFGPIRKRWSASLAFEGEGFLKDALSKSVN